MIPETLKPSASPTAWPKPEFRLSIISLFCALSLFGWPRSTQASLLTTTVSQLGGGAWTDANIWQTNGAGAFATGGMGPSAAVAAGNDFEVLNNGSSFAGVGAITLGQASWLNAGVRTSTANPWSFYANSLTMDSGTILGIKSGNGGVLNWTNGGLILQGGSGINIRDAGTGKYTFNGNIQIGPSAGTVYSISGNVMGAGGSASILWNPTQLTGSGDLAFINTPTSQAGASQFNGPSNGGWTGNLQIKCGYVQVNGFNPLASGSVVCDPLYDTTSIWLGGVNNGPATVEPMNDLTCPGTLTLQNGGKIVLHQDVQFSAATIEFAPLSAGRHTFAELNSLYPQNFPAPGKGGIIVGSAGSSAPAAPVNLYAINGNQQVTLGWFSGGNGPTGYIVKRSSTHGGPYTPISQVAFNVKSITDTGLTNGIANYYVIIATNSFGSSAPSAEIAGTPNPIVTGLVVVSQIGQASLSWNAFPGAVSYNVERGFFSGGPYDTNVATAVTTTNYVDVFPAGAPFQTVYYSIVANVAGGQSGNSAEASGIEGMALKEEWTASSLTNSLTDGAAVTSWPGNILGTPANAGANAPTFALSATPAGKPSIRFSQTAGNVLTVPGASSPIGGLTSFSETLVFRANALGAVGGNWYQQTGLTDAEQGGVTYDWGTALDSNGHLNFGIGSGDVTDVYTNFFVVGGFHVAVLVWDSAAGQMRLTVDRNPTQTYNNGPAGNPRNFGDIRFGNVAGGTGVHYLDGDLAEVGIYNSALPISVATNVANQLIATYGATVGTVTISNFQATPNPVNKGQITTLSWVAQQGATITITPTNGLAASYSASGSAVVTPGSDTTYSLHATLNGVIAISNVLVQILGTASNSLVDAWFAADLTNAANGLLTDGAPVNAWLSQSNRLAALDFGGGAETAPVFKANGGFGIPVVTFQGSDPSVSVPGYLRATNSPVGGLSAFTIGMVFRANTNFPPTTAQGAWFNEVDLMDAEQPGGDQDWGATINASGNCSFGIGNPDQTIHGNGGISVIDGNYHTMVAAWSGGAQTMRLYVDGKSAAALNGGMGSLARNFASMTIGGPQPGYAQG